jgi:DNA-binding MarR family transcriptional regulator
MLAAAGLPLWLSRGQTGSGAVLSADGPLVVPGAPESTFRLLYETSVAAAGVLEPEPLAELAAARARQLAGADTGVVYWWVPERRLLVPLAADPPDPALGDRPLAPGEGAAGAAFATGQPQVGDGALAVPLPAGGEGAGALYVRRDRRSRWRSRQVETLTLLAAVLGPALAAAREHADLAAAEEGFRAIFADAQSQLLALVREFGVHRTDETPTGETVSMSEHQALMELSGGDELSQTALAERLRLEKSTVSRLAAQMEARGWLERNRDPADARLVRLRLTTRGRELAGRLAAVRAGRLRGMLATVPESDRDAVVQALQVVARALQGRSRAAPGETGREDGT